MQLALFNGSPRIKKSNSKILIDQFLKGYIGIIPGQVPIHYLANRKLRVAQLVDFQKADSIILIFPLYTDCMPGIVKEFFEEILELDRIPFKKIGFIVQSGFPEAVHSMYVERYLKKLTKRLQYEYLGTIVKPGVEGIQMMPPVMTKKLFAKFIQLGEYFAKNGTFDPEIQKSLRKPYKLSPLKRVLLKIAQPTGLTNFYWNMNLKKNNAYENRFDRPYQH